MFGQYSNYELESIFKTITASISFNATEIAQQAGNTRASNIVILGAAAKYTGITPEIYKEAIIKMFTPKGTKIIDLNLKAFTLGTEIIL